MKNILNYVKHNNASFNLSPFNRVDALIFSWLSYFTYPEYIKRGKGIALKDVENLGLLPDKEMFAEAFNPKTSAKLFRILTASDRFGSCELSYFREVRDESAEKQFAAICVKFAPQQYFLSFRGTDPSFMAWKEDFSLACRFPLPSQVEAADYARSVMLKFNCAQFYFGGHSKGGTAAVYALTNVGNELQNRVMQVFNFDGPGFLKNECNADEFNAKTIKIVPHSAFVGMIFETGGNYQIVKSRSVSFLQHNPFFWAISDNDFIYLDKRTHGSVKLQKSLNGWIEDLSIGERERFINLLYGALYDLNTRSFTFFFKTLHIQIPALFRIYRRLNKDDKKFFTGTLKKFFVKYRTYKR